jgi:hypothetical protein
MHSENARRASWPEELVPVFTQVVTARYTSLTLGWRAHHGPDDTLCRRRRGVA